jgi:hypothetical protein
MEIKITFVTYIDHDHVIADKVLDSFKRIGEMLDDHCIGFGEDWVDEAGTIFKQRGDLDPTAVK